MMVTNENSVSKPAQAVQDYADLLSEMERITNLLLSALRSGDMEEAGRLIDVREKLCEMIRSCTSRLEDALQRNAEPDVVDALKVKHESLQKQQAQCQSALSAGLEKCKLALLDLNRRRDLQNTYSRTKVVGHARFLDSKL